MFGFRANKSASTYGVLVDIGSGTVGVAIVASNQGDILPKLLYTHRFMMRVSEHSRSQSDNFRKVREALLSASLVLSQAGYSALREHDPKARITRMYVTCSSPWSYTISRNVDYKANEPFKVTQALITELIEGAEREMITHLSGETTFGKDGFDVVEQSTVDVTINEYPVPNPIGLKGTALSLSHIAGLVPKGLLTFIHETQDKLFPNTELRIHTCMLVMYCVLRDLFPRAHTLCIIDVTGEATEFGIVENNLLIENSNIPSGSLTLVRETMGETDKPESDVLTSIQAFGDHTEMTEPPFSKHMQKYEEAVTKAFSSILERRMLPSSIVITAHRPFEKIFKHMVTSAYTTATKKVPTILSIEPKVIEEISEGANGDVYLALGARFFHKIHACGEELKD